MSRQAAGIQTGIFLAMALAGCAQGTSATAATAGGEASGPAAEAATGPAVTVVSADYPALAMDTLGGGHFDLADERGKWVVVNFWATWCTPCIKEMPELSALHGRRDDVTVVGLAYEETDEPSLQAFLAERPVGYPVAIADPFDPPPGFATPRGLPMTFLIGPDGRLIEQFLGPVTGSQLEQAIEQAIEAAAGQG